jgi:DNA recombination protein RmuC
LEKTLEKMDVQVRSLEEKRAGAYQRLEQHLQQLGQDQSQLRSATLKLEQALKSSTVRGRWGELQLRRVMELAGMSAHIDFDEQVTTDEGRPDVIVHLPNSGLLPVDAKTPMTSYFEALDADGEKQQRLLNSHAQAMKNRIQDLSRKSYWSQFERAPEMVVMFVPSEGSLSAAFSVDPNLLEFAMERHVFVVSPVLLLALLRSVAYGWQQQEIAENARQIARQGKNLYDCVVRFLDLFQRTGKGLSQAVDAYDRAVGSLERRLIPSARKFKDLNAETKELPEVTTLDKQPRLLDSSANDQTD